MVKPDKICQTVAVTNRTAYGLRQLSMRYNMFHQCLGLFPVYCDRDPFDGDNEARNMLCVQTLPNCIPGPPLQIVGERGLRLLTLVSGGWLLRGHLVLHG